jgi:hypothetical protein
MSKGQGDEERNENGERHGDEKRDLEGGGDREGRKIYSGRDN